METHRTNDIYIGGFLEKNAFRVTGAPIRGFDWVVFRKYGGTVAFIAGPSDENPEDEEVIIEEWNDPQNRQIWDQMTDEELAKAAYDTIIEFLSL